jgi:hypothetical protein
MITDEGLESVKIIIKDEVKELAKIGDMDEAHEIILELIEQEQKKRAATTEDVQRAITAMTYIDVRPKYPSSIAWVSDEERQLAITALRQMQGWRPVTEGLPHDNVRVLILQENTYPEMAYWGESSAMWWKSGYLPINNVTHWMPLPELPETNKFKEDKYETNIPV